MSVYDDVAAALPELRAEAESLMRETFEVYIPGGTPTWNPDTEGYDAAPLVLYSGPGRELSSRSGAAPGEEDAAGEAVRDLGVIVALPWDVDTRPFFVQEQTAEVRVVASPVLSRVGRILKLRAVATSTYLAETRLLCDLQAVVP